MVRFYLIVISKHRLPDTIFLYYIFLITVSSKYLVGYMHLLKYISLKQITFSHTYTHVEKVEKVNV